MTSHFGPAGPAESVRTAYVHRPRPFDPPDPAKVRLVSSSPCRNRPGVVHDFVRDPHPFSSIVTDRGYTFLALHDVESTYIVGHAVVSR